MKPEASLLTTAALFILCCQINTGYAQTPQELLIGNWNCVHSADNPFCPALEFKADSSTNLTKQHNGGKSKYFVKNNTIYLINSNEKDFEIDILKLSKDSLQIKLFASVICDYYRINGTSASGASNNNSGFIKLTAEQWKKLEPETQQKNSAAKTGCRLVNCKKVCVPGCDPPREDGTITGCSSCYSWYWDCELICDK